MDAYPGGLVHALRLLKHRPWTNVTQIRLGYLGRFAF